MRLIMGSERNMSRRQTQGERNHRSWNNSVRN
jgi:hypothetical protein